MGGRQVTQMCFYRKCSAHPVANVPAAVGHGRSAMAAAASLSTVGTAAGTTSVGARTGTRAAVVPTGATVGVGPAGKQRGGAHRETTMGRRTP